MDPREITPHLPVEELYCSEFRRDAFFTNWRPSGSGDWLLIYTEAGGGRFVSPLGSCETQPGDAVLYAPTDCQDYSTAPGPGSWNLLWVHFVPKPHWQIWLHWPLAESGLRLLRLEPGEARDQFRAAMNRMIGLFRREIPGAQDLASNALESALLWANVALSKEQWLAIDPRVRHGIDYLVAHLREPFVLSQLARHCGLSVSRLACLFKEQTGASPQQFLERHRMRHACQLLGRTSLSIAEVATEVGYADAFYFSNRFHRHTGKSPSRYRKDAAGV